MPRILKDSGIPWAGQIPGNWYVHRVKFHFQHHKYIAGVKASNYDRLALTMQGVIKRSKEDNDGLQPLDFTSYQVLKKDELVFKLIDLQNISTSRVGLSPFTGVVSPAYIILHAQKDTLPRYAMYFFLFMWLDNIFNSLGDAGVRSSLNASDLLNLPFILPSLEEQKKIADFLDKKCGEVDALAHNIQQQIDTLEQYKRAIITEIVTKGLNPSAPMKGSGIPWIGQIPKHWVVTKIKYIAKSNQKALSEKTSLDLEICYIDIGSVSERNGIECTEKYIFKNAPSRARRIVQTGDCIVSTVRTYLKAIAFIDVSCHNYIVSTGFSVLTPNKQILADKYLFFLLKNHPLISAISAYSTGVNYPAINDSVLINLKVALPPQAEQQNMVLYLDEKCGKIDALIKTKQEQLAKLEEYKKAIIFEYVTGKKEVPEEER